MGDTGTNKKMDSPAPKTALGAWRSGLKRDAPLAQLSRWLLLGEWRAQPVRAIVAVTAIALGIALGFAIHLINAAAFNEFSAAIKGLSGQADIQVSAREALFNETIYPWLAQHDGVAVASPVLELDAVLPGRRSALKIIGLDVFRAGAVTPGLIGAPVSDRRSDLTADDTLFLSAAAMTWLKLAPGAKLSLRTGTHDITLRVAGFLQRTPVGQRLGVMDLGALQWRFNKLGQLSRIDLKLRDGVDRNALQAALARELGHDFPGEFSVNQPNDENQNSRIDNLSRAYRVNLTVLALVALFTGAFLVFSTQALSVVRRRGQFALLRVLGMSRTQLLRQVLMEGACLGIAGSLLGIAGGYAMAAAALHFFGGDLGAGYFSGVQPEVQFTPAAALIYFGLGLAVALLGCAAPAYEAARAEPAAALKSGSEEAALAKLAKTWPAIACLFLAGLLARAPPLFELPLSGYLSIALLLVGSVGLMPQMTATVFRFVNHRCARSGQPVLSVTLARLANASSQAAIALGGVLSSFSLMVAMAVMVSSFRVSVDDWLGQILAADLYVHTASSGNTAALNRQEQASIEALPGIARVDFLRSRPLALAPGRPNVTLMARSIDADHPGRSMVLLGAPMPVSAASLPVWVSEAMADLYSIVPGATIELPLNGRMHAFFVAGVWRDYARQGGALQMRLSDYRALTGDLDVNDVGLWLDRGVSVNEAQERLQRLPFGRALELARPSEIRALSLKIFDRSFAVTYLLEAIAIVVGLFGVAATFSGQALTRAKEFGMLRHIGMTRSQIISMLAIESGALTALGIAVGFGLGCAISLILVFVVNPQSFHWSMGWHMPWPMLGIVAAGLMLASTLTALVAGRYALSGGPIRAVREDW